jgi:uncharacterized cupredoxin-like copper-binding protein
MCCGFVLACAPPPEREIVVGMTEYAFVPRTIELMAAERVRLVVRNVGRLEHDFMADERGRALGLAHLHLSPGASMSQDWTAPANPTDIRIVCTVLGHETLGMVGHIVIAPRSRAGPAASP